MRSHTHENKRVLWIILALSSSYMVAEIIGGIVSGSLSLLADAGHMATDIAAMALGLFAIFISSRPPSDHKTYGYYRAEILAALVNGAALVALSFWIFYEGWERLHQPHVVQGSLMTVVAAGGLVVNLIALAVSHGHKDHSLNLRGVWLHILSDALGSLSVVIAGVLVWAFNWTLADPIISFVVGTLILINSWQLLVECVNVLLEGVPKGMALPEIRKGIENLPGIADVHDLHVWTVTSGVHALSAHVRLTQSANHSSVLSEINLFLKEKYSIDHSTIQLEPVGYNHDDLHF